MQGQKQPMPVYYSKTSDKKISYIANSTQKYLSVITRSYRNILLDFSRCTGFSTLKVVDATAAVS